MEIRSNAAVTRAAAYLLGDGMFYAFSVRGGVQRHGGFSGLLDAMEKALVEGGYDVRRKDGGGLVIDWGEP